MDNLDKALVLHALEEVILNSLHSFLFEKADEFSSKMSRHLVKEVMSSFKRQHCWLDNEFYFYHVDTNYNHRLVVSPSIDLLLLKEEIYNGPRTPTA